MTKPLLYLVVLALGLNLVACIAPLPSHPAPTSDGALLALAEQLSDKSPVDFELDYGIDFSTSLPLGTVGVCRSYKGRAWQIHIEPFWWENASQTAREALLLHEIMHCETGMAHVRSIYDSTAKLMGTRVTDSIDCIEKNGHGFCILEALYLYEENIIGRGF